jgi:hypothetical protein
MELKQQLIPYLISVFVFLVLSGIIMGLTIRHNINPIIPLLLVIFFFTQITIFLYSLKEKFLKDSNYLFYSLPTKRYPVLLIKFLVLTTYLIISLIILIPLSFLDAHFEIIMMKKILADRGVLYHSNNGFLYYVLHNDMFFFLVKLFSILTFFLSGVLIFVKTLRYMFRWFYVSFQTFIVLFLFILFCKFGFVDTPFQGTVLGPFSIINAITTGIVFLIIGLTIFEKYGEI